MSNLAGYFGNLYIPHFLRNPLFGLYAKTYNVKLEDMVKAPSEYTSFVDFFTREVKPRNIDPNSKSLVAPADSKVLTISEVKENDILLIKDIKYSMGEFLTGNKEEKFNSVELEGIKMTNQKKEKTKLWSAIFYLSPGDYHRYHSPCDFEVKNRKHIVGYLYPVKISYIEKTPRVYEDNERVALFGKWNKGLMTQVYVGATNVGSMTLKHEGDKFETNVLSPVGLDKTNSLAYPEPVSLKKGAEVGMFKLGSTVVMIFEAPESFKWDIKEGQAVRYGEVIGSYK